MLAECQAGRMISRTCGRSWQVGRVGRRRGLAGNAAATARRLRFVGVLRASEGLRIRKRAVLRIVGRRFGELSTDKSGETRLQAGAAGFLCVLGRVDSRPAGAGGRITWAAWPVSYIIYLSFTANYIAALQPRGARLAIALGAAAATVRSPIARGMR